MTDFNHAVFQLTFDEAIDVETISKDDFELYGSEEATVVSVTENGDEDGTSFAVRVEGLLDQEEVGLILTEDSVENASGFNVNARIGYSFISGFESSISAGYYGTCAIKSNGTVQCWGQGVYGANGNGSTSTQRYPVNVSNLNNVIQLTATGYNVRGHCALKTDGTVWCWGYNGYGQLGTGNTSNYTTPQRVQNLSNVVKIGGGYQNTYAIKEDGTVWAWGTGSTYANGDGTTTQRTTPVQVSNLSHVVDVAGRYQGACALKSDGTVWCWGYGSHGENGDGSNSHRSTPVQVSNLTDVIQVAQSQHTSYALKADGTVWSWGNDSNGALGSNQSSTRNTPIQVTNLQNIIQIEGRMYYGATALRSDGSIWSWGYGGHGENGNNSTSNRGTPIRVVNYSDFVSIDNGVYHSCGLRSNATIWCWGNDSHYAYSHHGSSKSSPYQRNNISNVRLDAKLSTGVSSSVTVTYKKTTRFCLSS